MRYIHTYIHTYIYIYIYMHSHTLSGVILFIKPCLYPYSLRPVDFEAGLGALGSLGVYTDVGFLNMYL